MIRILKLEWVENSKVVDCQLGFDSDNCVPSSFDCFGFIIGKDKHSFVRLTCHQRKLSTKGGNVIDDICHIQQSRQRILIGPIRVQSVCIGYEIDTCSVEEQQGSFLIPNVIACTFSNQNVRKLREISPKVPNFKESLVNSLIGIFSCSDFKFLCRCRVYINVEIDRPAVLRPVDSHCYSIARRTALKSVKLKVVLRIEALCAIWGSTNTFACAWTSHVIAILKSNIFLPSQIPRLWL